MRRVAKAIEDDPAASAYLSGPALARRTGVSQATVVRFAQALGYSGYPSFLDAHRREVAGQTTVDKLKGSFADLGDAPWRRVMLSDLANLERTMSELDERQFEAAVRLIANARRAYVWGVRTTATVGELITTTLSYLLGADRVMRLQPTLYREQLLGGGPDDVAIVVSFPRYFRMSIEAAEFARERRVPLLAITDSVLSPIARPGSVVLCARSELLSFTESFVAPISLANALVTAVALAHRDRSLAALARLEELWSKERLYHSEERRHGSGFLGG
jgi:DNA-binding MurR/RpiR family transcriptional regulator